MFGMLSPSSRGALVSAGFAMFMLMGFPCGYFAGRLFKTIDGKSDWKASAFQTAVLYPGIVFGISFILNFFIWGKKSSGAVPFTTMLAILFLWFGLSVPSGEPTLFQVESDNFNMIFSFPRLLPRHKEARLRAPGAHEPNPAPNPRATVVHEFACFDAHGRYFALWRGLH